MNIIGITGGTGTGKGLVSCVFSSYGYPVYDCDKEYHALVSYYSPCVRELEQVFGREIITANGALDRVALRKIVFSSGKGASALLQKLNSISHYHVKQNLRAWCEDLKKTGVTTVVVDAPTLFQADLEGECVAVIGVIAKEELRLERIMARDGLDETTALQRIRAQLTDDFYRTHCDFIVENNGAIDDVHMQTEKIILEFRKRGILQ